MDHSIQIPLQGKASESSFSFFPNLTQSKINDILSRLNNIISYSGRGTSNYPSKLFESSTGKTVRLTKSPIELACGMLESDGHEVDRFMEQKRLEKELEYGG